MSVLIRYLLIGAGMSAALMSLSRHSAFVLQLPPDSDLRNVPNSPVGAERSVWSACRRRGCSNQGLIDRQRTWPCAGVAADPERPPAQTDDVPWMRDAADANWKEVRGGVRPNAQSFPSSAYMAGRRLARCDISCEQWTTRASARVASGPRTRCKALTAAAPTLPPRRGSALTPPNQKRERLSEPLSV